MIDPRHAATRIVLPRLTGGRRRVLAVLTTCAAFACLLCLAFHLLAQEGLSPNTPATARDGVNVDDATAQQLWRRVVELRNRCAVDGAEAWDAFVTGEARARLDEINHQVWDDDPDLAWSNFFARSLFEIARPNSPAPLVGCRQVLNQVNAPAVSVQLLEASLCAMELDLGRSAFDDPRTVPPVLERLIDSCHRFLTAGSEGNAAFFIHLAHATSPAAASLLSQMPPEAYTQLVAAYWVADEQWAQAYWVPDHNPDYCIALTYQQIASRLQLIRTDAMHFPSIAAVVRSEANP